MKRKALILIAALSIAGCATKQYPQAATVTSEETLTMNCQDIQREIAKTKSIQHEIETTGEFDGRTVLGALGDFGIGNGMAKSEARKKAAARLNQLESIKTVKCQPQI